MPSRYLSRFVFVFVLAILSRNAGAQYSLPSYLAVGSGNGFGNGTPAKDSQGNSLSGFANSGRAFTTDGTTVLVTNRPGPNDGTSCGKDWGLYAAPIKGDGPIVPLVTSATQVEPGEPVGTSASICNNARIAGSTVIYSADYIPTGGQERYGFFMLPLAGGPSSDVLANGDTVAPGVIATAPRSPYSGNIGGLTPQIVSASSFGSRIFAVDTSTANGLYRQIHDPSGTSIEIGAVALGNGISCNGFTLAPPSAIAVSTDGSGNTVGLATATLTGSTRSYHTVILAGGFSSLSCDQVVYDPYDYNTGTYKPFPGEPTQPAGYVLPAPALTIGASVGGVIYFGVSRQESNSYYSGIQALFGNGIFDLDFAAIASIPGIPYSTNPCINGTTDFPLVEPNFAANAKNLVFVARPATYDCNTGKLTTQDYAAHVYTYNFVSQQSKTDLLLLELGSQPYGRWALNNGMLSADNKLLIGVISSQDSNGNPLTTDLWSTNLDQIDNAVSISAPGTSTYGKDVTVTVKITPQSTALGPLSGKLYLYEADGSRNYGYSPYDSTGQATITLSNLSVGTHSLMASYDSDFNYYTAASAAVSVSVSKADTNIVMLPSDGVRVSQGVPNWFNVTVSSSTGGSPTGTVTFYDGTTSLGSASLPMTPPLIFPLPTNVAGPHSFKAIYSGDDNFNGSSVTNTVYVTIPTTLTASFTPTNPAYGNSIGVTVSATQGTAPAPPSGTFFYYLDNAAGIQANFGSTFNLGVLPAGNHTLKLYYTGDNNFTDGSVTVPFTVTKATLSVKADDATRPYGTANPSFTGTITGAVAADGITVSYGSQATATSPAGNYAITPLLADPNGKLTNYSVTNTPGVLTVTKASDTLTLTAPGTTAPVNTNIQLSATVTSATNSIPTGLVSFYANGTLLGTGNLNYAGLATFTYTTSTAGPVAFTATYPGDSNFAAPANGSVSVLFGVPDFTLTASPTTLTIAAGNSGTITFTMTPSFGYSQSVNLSCSGLPANTTCAFNPATLTPNGGPVSSVLTVQTNVKSAGLETPRLFGRGGAELALIVLGLPGLVLLRRRRFTSWALMAFLGLNLLALTGCAGSSTSNPPVLVTPAGTNTVSVTAAASAGTGSGSHAVSVTIIVQ